MQKDFDIHDLEVTHRPKRPGRAAVLPPDPPGSFVVDTCLRQLSIGRSLTNRFPAVQNFTVMSNRPAWAEVRSGSAAYELLLNVTTGLLSAVPGETNIFGQFKKAWLNFQRTRPATGLAPIIAHLIDDTKAIRLDHLEGIGGSSYGGLVRKLISPKRNDRILFVGAGALARSMLPLFRNHRLGIWNHRDIESLPRHIECVFTPQEGRRAARWAEHVILTTPPEPQNDASWSDWLDAAHPHSVVHLGHRRSQQSQQLRQDLSDVPVCYDLDDVFALRREQDELRSEQLSLARAACRERAMALSATARRVSRTPAAVNAIAEERNIRESGLALA